MGAKHMPAEEAGLPRFDVSPSRKSDDPDVFPFELSSHARARESLDFGLRIDEPGFNIFVVGEGRSGRLTATRAYLESYVKRNKSTPSDWVYLNNFRRPHKPKPYRLPAGHGRRFRQRLADLIDQLGDAIRKAAKDDTIEGALREDRSRYQEAMHQESEALTALARSRGIHLAMTPNGPVATPLDSFGNPRSPDTLNADERREFSEAWLEIQDAFVA